MFNSVVQENIEESLLTYLQNSFGFSDVDLVSLVPINDKYLVRLKSSEGMTHILLQTEKLGERDAHQFVLCHGQIIKTDTEYIEFENLFKFSNEALTEKVTFGEDHIYESQGIIVSPDGKVTQIEAEHQQVQLHEQKNVQPCTNCSKSTNTGESLLVERKVKQNRCKFCTGVTLVVGFLLSSLFAWLIPILIFDIEATTLTGSVFIAGMLYTAWRVYYWGYLPFQDIIGRRVEMIRSNAGRHNPYGIS